MSDDEQAVMELPQIWQFVHPHYDQEDSEEDEESGSDEDLKVAPAATSLDYVKLSRKAPKMGRLLRFLNDIEDDEDLQQIVLERDPVTQQSLLQWASLNGHFMLVEYVVKRLHRFAFSFDPDWEDVVVYNRWEEMRHELPAAADVAERHKVHEQERAARLAERAANHNSEDDEDEYFDEEEEEELEPMPEELVYDTLEEYHDQWGDRGVGVVKRIGELGVYHGTRLRDGTKQGLGQSLFPNGDCYTGEYRNNQREGTGVYWWSQASTMYTGDWLRNMRHGRGRMVYPDGSRYLGHWKDDKKSGEGCYTYADGSRYTGAWVDNEKHGQGRYEFTDGSSYVGSFYHNEFISGEWWLASGTSRYVGSFVNDRPDGAGVFVHRCGLKHGAFQQEGVYRDGRWYPGTLKGSAKVAPRLEMVVPGQGNTRVPVEFAEECTGHTMADLVRATNFAPLQEWLHGVVATTSLTLKRVELVSLTYDAETAGSHRLVELRVRPLLIRADGTRYRPSPAESIATGTNEDDTVLTMRKPSCRLMVLLRCGSDDTAQTDVEETPEPVVIVERVAGSEAQYRLPVVCVTPEGKAEGDCCARVGTALRLCVHATTVCPLVEPRASDLLNGNVAESVVLYAQEVHPDAFTTLSEKLQQLSTSSSVAHYVTVPLRDLAASADSTEDALTALAVTTAVQRSEDRTLPHSTVAPQRPPTPIPPAAEPRPELQPLYEAKAVREAAEEEESDA